MLSRPVLAYGNEDWVIRKAAERMKFMRRTACHTLS
jgi:hypothetical protein